MSYMSQSVEKAKQYLENREIPQLFEAFITSLMYEQPDDHIEYLQQCLEKIKTNERHVKSIRWDSFIDHSKPRRLQTPQTPVYRTNESEQSDYAQPNQQHHVVRVQTPRVQTPTPRNEPTSPVSAPRVPTARSARGEERVQTPKVQTQESHNDELSYHRTESRKLSASVVNKSVVNIADLRNKSANIREIKSADRVRSATKSAKSARSARVQSTRAFDNVEVVFVIGGPGSGKGTQCVRIAQKFDFVHLSSGDLLRAEVKSGSQLGQDIEGIMKSGGLVPDDLVLELIKAAMREALPTSKRFLLDGYPRKVEQALQFERRVAQCFLALYLNVSDETMTSRLLNRALTSGRADDNEETIKQRLITFHDSTEPVIEYYKKQGKLRNLECEGTPDDIFADVENVFNNAFQLRGKLMIFVIGGPGSGKGTQCDKIAKKYDFKHLSSGDLLRAEVQSGSELGESLNEIMREGKLVPLDTILSLLRTAILLNANDYNGFLIDGYPRDILQGERFEGEIASCNLALYLEVSDEVMTSRLLERGKTSGRVDDNEQTIQNRLNLFHQVTQPVIEYYKANGKLRAVNSEQSPDEVFMNVEFLLDEVVAAAAAAAN